MAKSSTTKPSAAKDVPIIPSAAKVEMPMPSKAKPSAAKEMSTIPSTAMVEEMPTPSAAKMEMPKPSTAKPSAAEPIIPSAVKLEEMPMPSTAKIEMPKSSTTKPSAAKDVPTIPSTAKVEEMPTPSAAKMEMPKPSTAMPSAAKEMPIIPSTAKVEMRMPSTAKMEMPKPSTAKPSAAKEMPIIPSAVKEMPRPCLHSANKEMLIMTGGAEEYPEMLIGAIKVEVPDTPPVVSSLTKPSQTSVSSVQPHMEEDEVVILKETVSKKFGEMTFSDYNSAEDMDFCLSEAEMDDTDDSLEWASETERTRAEDDLSEDKVGIDYISAALDIATEQAASFRIVQAGLVIGDWFLGAVESFSCISSSEVAPLLSSVRRSARKIRRAGERESGPFRPLGMVSESTMKMATTFLAAPLALLGWEFVR